MLREELQVSTKKIIELEEFLVTQQDECNNQLHQSDQITNENKKLRFQVAELRDKIPEEQYQPVKYDAIDR